MRIAQILNDKAHFIFEANEIPNLPPDASGNPIVLIDITNSPNVKEGWNYNNITQSFSRPIIEQSVSNFDESQAVTTNEEIQKNQMIIMQALADIFEVIEGEY